jgi:hypothetical protein
MHGWLSGELSDYSLFTNYPQQLEQSIKIVGVAAVDSARYSA